MKVNTLFNLLACLSILLLLQACGSSSSSDSDDSVCGGVTEISPNGMLNGTLTSSDCEIEDLFPGTNDNSYADQYRFTVNVPVTMTITLRSSEIDAFLVLLDTANTCARGCDLSIVLAADDDSGGGVNGLDSQIVIFLNPGSYIILANSFVRQTGNYTIETMAM